MNEMKWTDLTSDGHVDTQRTMKWTDLTSDGHVDTQRTMKWTDWAEPGHATKRGKRDRRRDRAYARAMKR
jgi:hypothetical protein